jgi:hypothetical protein
MNYDKYITYIKFGLKEVHSWSLALQFHLDKSIAVCSLLSLEVVVTVTDAWVYFFHALFA